MSQISGELHTDALSTLCNKNQPEFSPQEALFLPNYKSCKLNGSSKNTDTIYEIWQI